MKYISLNDKIKNSKIINTHSHHERDGFFVDFNLAKLLKRTYIDWSGVTFSDSNDSRQNYLDKVKFKSYFVWLIKAIKDIYDIKDDLSVNTWNLYDDKIKSAHQKDKDWHKSILKDICGYKKIILDAYWDPGSHNDDPSLFSSAFRVNPLFFGYNQDAKDHNGVSVYNLYDRTFDNLDKYMDFIKNLILVKKNNGSVAIKIPLAYDRGLDFKNISKQKASVVFESTAYLESDQVNFQDYLCFEICAFASEIDMPVQIHTGMGGLNKTAPINLLPLIKQNPKTKFVLFHGGYPWTGDITALMHLYPNVYADICWLPILSFTGAKHMLHQLIEVGTSDKITWGCDTWTSEESYGARLALNELLKTVLSEKIESKYLSLSDADIIVDNIMYNNAKNLYKL